MVSTSAVFLGQFDKSQLRAVRSLGDTVFVINKASKLMLDSIFLHL